MYIKVQPQSEGKVIVALPWENTVKTKENITYSYKKDLTVIDLKWAE